MPKIRLYYNNIMKIIPTEINTGCFIKSVQGAWVQQCYLDNRIGDIVNCVSSCTTVSVCKGSFDSDT